MKEKEALALRQIIVKICRHRIKTFTGHRHRVLRDIRHRGTRHFSTATLVSLYLKADLTQADLA